MLKTIYLNIEDQKCQCNMLDNMFEFPRIKETRINPPATIHLHFSKSVTFCVISLLLFLSVKLCISTRNESIRAVIW